MLTCECFQCFCFAPIRSTALAHSQLFLRPRTHPSLCPHLAEPTASFPPSARPSASLPYSTQSGHTTVSLLSPRLGPRPAHLRPSFIIQFFLIRTTILVWACWSSDNIPTFLKKYKYGSVSETVLNGSGLIKTYFLGAINSFFDNVDSKQTT